MRQAPAVMSAQYFDSLKYINTTLNSDHPRLSPSGRVVAFFMFPRKPAVPFLKSAIFFIFVFNHRPGDLSMPGVNKSEL
jgi:hypothetical protein